MLGPGRGKPVRAIGAGGRQRLAHPFDQYSGHRRHGDSQPYCLPATGDNVRNEVGTIEHQGHRARPERSSEAVRCLRPSGGTFFRLGGSCHVNNKWIDARPSLGVVDSFHGGGVGGDRAQAVDCFGRERNQSSARQHSGCVRHVACGGVSGINLKHSGFHQKLVISQSIFFRAVGSGGFSPRAWKSVFRPS